jgi:hypothetical protein
VQHFAIFPCKFKKTLYSNYLIFDNTDTVYKKRLGLFSFVSMPFLYSLIFIYLGFSWISNDRIFLKAKSGNLTLTGLVGLV